MSNRSTRNEEEEGKEREQMSMGLILDGLFEGSGNKTKRVFI